LLKYYLLFQPARKSYEKRSRKKACDFLEVESCGDSESEAEPEIVKAIKKKPVRKKKENEVC